MKLNQCRATAHVSSQIFAVHAPSVWNKLSVDITVCKSFQKFRRLLKKHFSAEQYLFLLITQLFVTFR